MSQKGTVSKGRSWGLGPVSDLRISAGLGEGSQPLLLLLSLPVSGCSYLRNSLLVLPPGSGTELPGYWPHLPEFLTLQDSFWNFNFSSSLHYLSISLVTISLENFYFLGVGMENWNVFFFLQKPPELFPTIRFLCFFFFKQNNPQAKFCLSAQILTWLDLKMNERRLQFHKLLLISLRQQGRGSDEILIFGKGRLIVVSRYFCSKLFCFCLFNVWNALWDLDVWSEWEMWR
jgi:hypothetical protein